MHSCCRCSAPYSSVWPTTIRSDAFGTIPYSALSGDTILLLVSLYCTVAWDARSVRQGIVLYSALSGDKNLSIGLVHCAVAQGASMLESHRFMAISA